MEQELMAFVSNQGLAVAVSGFLIWWVTTQLTKTQEKIADALNLHDRRTEPACEKINAIGEKVDKIYSCVVLEEK